MPNMLAHLGVGALATRLVAPDADPKWIFAGCVIPDLPWIFQRLIQASPLDIDLYALRLYAIAQASLVGCILISAALACVSHRPWYVFKILVANATLHLLLDACQTKWASGVHLFAPISWKALNLGIFWPESLMTYTLTILGLVYFIYVWWRGTSQPIPLAAKAPGKIGFAMLLSAFYFATPIVMMHGVFQEDCQFVRTLMEVSKRSGRFVEFDRNQSIPRKQGHAIRTFVGEELDIVGATWGQAPSVSVRGTFLDERTVLVSESHVHRLDWRDRASMAGLCLVLMSWVIPHQGR